MEPLRLYPHCSSSYIQYKFWHSARFYHVCAFYFLTKHRSPIVAYLRKSKCCSLKCTLSPLRLISKRPPLMLHLNAFPTLKYTVASSIWRKTSFEKYKPLDCKKGIKTTKT